MLYDINLLISYTYGGFGAGGRHVARLLPAELPGEQRLVAGALDVAPRPDDRSSWTDFFGNKVVEVAFLEVHKEVDFTVVARVNRMLPATPLDMSPRLGEIGNAVLGYHGLDAASPHHFLGTSPRVSKDPDIARFAAELTQPGQTVFEVAHGLTLALQREMAFDSEATTVDTPPGEAFARRRGVCQDFTHVMIAALRSLGVPAGYVSGFLRTRPPAGQERLEGADAMHAWVRVWCGKEMGWIEFDPTNGLVVANDHIVVARGRDYGDVSPVKGSLKIAGDHTSEHKVDVLPLA
jgi:transglutaminase-like putative cysteine protease